MSCGSKARNPREERMPAVQGMNYVAGLLLLVSQNEVPSETFAGPWFPQHPQLFSHSKLPESLIFLRWKTFGSDGIRS